MRGGAQGWPTAAPLRLQPGPCSLHTWTDPTRLSLGPRAGPPAVPGLVGLLSLTPQVLTLTQSRHNIPSPQRSRLLPFLATPTSLLPHPLPNCWKPLIPSPFLPFYHFNVTEMESSRRWKWPFAEGDILWRLVQMVVGFNSLFLFFSHQ